MHHKPELLIIAVVLLFVFSTSFSQDNRQNNTAAYSEILKLTHEKYGIDQQLTNGVYFEDTYRGAQGHPYLLSDEYVYGDVTFYGIAYTEIPLKYDLYAQRLVIYREEDPRVFSSILANQFVEEFNLYGLQFRKMTLQDKAPAFYQVVAETEALQCYYAWYRIRRESIDENDTKLYIFTEDMQRRYLVIDNEGYRYFNNWTFTRIFDSSLRRKIRSFLRKHDLKIQKATDEQVREVIQYTAQLIHQSDL